MTLITVILELVRISVWSLQIPTLTTLQFLTRRNIGQRADKVVYNMWISS